MPRTSDGCQKVCEILLLFELLKRQRPDLNLGRVESLLALVGRLNLGRLLSPRKSRAAMLIADGVRGRGPRPKPKTPVDVIIAGLEEAPAALPAESPATQLRETGAATSAVDLLEPLLSRPLPGFPSRFLPVQIALRDEGKVATAARKRIRAILNPLTQLASDDRAQNLACAVALPFAFKAVTSGIPLVSAAGAVTLIGCGIEIAVDDPSFIGPGIIEQLPELLRGGR